MKQNIVDLMKEHPRNPRGTLWICSYNGIGEDTFLSVLGEGRVWPNLTIRVKKGDANIDRARSKVSSWFLQEPREDAGDVLLMVDADNSWMQGDLAKIAKRALEHNAVVGGIYPKRAFNQGPALRLAAGAEGDYQIGRDELIPAEFVGTGFIAIPRDILETLSGELRYCKGGDGDPHPGYWPFFMPYVLPLSDGFEYPTDDHAFCARVRAFGFDVFASTYPRLHHDGAYRYRMVDSGVSPPPDRDMTFTLNAPQVAHA